MPLRFARFAAAFGLLALASGAGEMAGAQQAPPAPATSGAVNSTLGFAVRPLSATGTIPRGTFDYSLEAGQAVLDTAVVVNGTNQPKTFYVYAADAYNTPSGGGVTLAQRDQTPKDAGGWVVLSSGGEQVTIPGAHAAEIPFRVTVPRDAEPGDHSAGIVAEEVKPPTPPTQGAGLNVVARIGTALYVRVAGPVHPRLQIQKMSVSHHDPLIPFTSKSTDAITFTVNNTGNIRIQPDQVTVEITGLFGHKVKRFVLSRPAPGSAPTQAVASLPQEILPHNAVIFTRHWRGIPPLDILTAHITIKGEDASLHGPINVTRTLTVWVIPWVALLIVVILVIAAYAWRRWGRPRREPPGVLPDQPEPESPEGVSEPLASSTPEAEYTIQT